MFWVPKGFSTCWLGMPVAAGAEPPAAAAPWAGPVDGLKPVALGLKFYIFINTFVIKSRV